MNSYRKLTALLMLIMLMGCNKEEQDSERAIQVVLNGYNGGGNTLEMSIDTTRFGAGISNGKYLLKPESIIGTSIAYSFFDEKPRMLTLSEVESKKVLFSKPLPTAGTKAFFNFIYVDGKELEINPPTADSNTNKLGFYVQYADSDTPFDIFLYRMDKVTGQEFRYYLARNVKAKGWIYFDYTAPADFGDRSSLGNSSILFTKTGTIDQWAFQDNEAMSKISASSMSFPLTGETGLVLPFFFAHQTGLLNRSRLFFYPDRQW